MSFLHLLLQTLYPNPSLLLTQSHYQHTLHLHPYKHQTKLDLAAVIVTYIQYTQAYQRTLLYHTICMSYFIAIVFFHSYPVLLQPNNVFTCLQQTKHQTKPNYIHTCVCLTYPYILTFITLHTTHNYNQPISPLQTNTILLSFIKTHTSFLSSYPPLYAGCECTTHIITRYTHSMHSIQLPYTVLCVP